MAAAAALSQMASELQNLVNQFKLQPADMLARTLRGARGVGGEPPRPTNGHAGHNGPSRARGDGMAA